MGEGGEERSSRTPDHRLAPNLGKISAEVPTLITHSFCYSNSIRFWNRVSMKVMHV